MPRRLPAAERDARHATLVSSLGRDELLRAVEAGTRAFLGELRRGDPELANRLQPTLLAFVSGISEAVRENRPSA